MMKKFGTSAEHNVHNATVLDIDDFNKLGQKEEENKNNAQEETVEQ